MNRVNILPQRDGMVRKVSILNAQCSMLNLFVGVYFRSIEEAFNDIGWVVEQCGQIVA
jgi:hypothetical protein